MTHLLRYLLIFGDRKKKVELSVSDELENVKVETLKQKAKELFNLQNVILQIWDKGFEDWVDLDEGDPTPTNSRIKVEINKEAKSLSSDIGQSKRMPSNQTLLVATSKVGPPTVQVRPSYPAFALTPLEDPQAVSSPPSSIKLHQPSHPVSSPQSVALPQRTMSVSQRQFGTEQLKESQTVPGRTSSLAQSVTAEAGRSSKDGRTGFYRGATWSVVECKALIGIWCSNEIQSVLSDINNKNRNKALYKRIAIKLADCGFPVRPWDRVRDKMNRVKNEYRKIRKQLANGIGEDQIAFPMWYSEIHALYGPKLSYELPDLVDDKGDGDSSTMLDDQDDIEDRVSDDDNCSADSVSRDADPQGTETELVLPKHQRQVNAKEEVEPKGDDESWILHDHTATRGEKHGLGSNRNNKRSKRAHGMTEEELTEENSAEGENEEENALDRSGSQRYNLREIQVKIEADDYDDYYDDD